MPELPEGVDTNPNEGVDPQVGLAPESEPEPEPEPVPEKRKAKKDQMTTTETKEADDGSVDESS